MESKRGICRPRINLCKLCMVVAGGRKMDGDEKGGRAEGPHTSMRKGGVGEGHQFFWSGIIIFF